ncbi:hypothetical protein L0F63_004033 [Massospora cicadina]|nr:hypothetical protein L0F63_004033 [Massospora cicadina]
MLDSVTPQAAERMIVVVPFVLFYLALGLAGGFLFRKLFASSLSPTFNYSILVASGWSNWGDIPLAVIQNITSLTMFNKEDGSLAVAYIAVFLMVFNVTLFPLGGHRLIARDFKASKVQAGSEDIELGHLSQPSVESRPQTSQLANRMNSFLKFIYSLLTPINIGTVGGLVLGLTPAKAIFVGGPGNPILVANISPPLHFIYKTTNFLGAACVPISLLNLGASLVGVDLKRTFSPSNFVLALFKLILTPLIGISAVYWFTHGLGLIRPEEKILQLVLMFATCVPSATTSLVMYQFYSPSGEASSMSSLLILQYLVGAFTMTITLIVSLVLVL